MVGRGKRGGQRVDDQGGPHVPRRVEGGIGSPTPEYQPGGKHGRGGKAEVPQTQAEKAFPLVGKRHGDSDKVHEAHGDAEHQGPMARDVIQQGGDHRPVKVHGDERAEGAGMAGGPAGKDEIERQGPHDEPKAYGDAGLGRVGRGEQEEEQRQKEGRVGANRLAGGDAEAYHQKGHNQANQRHVQIELGHEPPKELAYPGGRAGIEKGLNERSGIGEQARAGLMHQEGKVEDEPRHGEKGHQKDAAPFEVVALLDGEFLPGCALAVGPDEGRPELEEVIFLDKTFQLAHFCCFSLTHRFDGIVLRALPCCALRALSRPCRRSFPPAGPMQRPANLRIFRAGRTPAGNEPGFGDGRFCINFAEFVYFCTQQKHNEPFRWT